MSEYEKQLEARLAKYKKMREMTRRGPTKVSEQQQKSAETRRLGSFLDKWRNKRKQAMREFNEK